MSMRTARRAASSLCSHHSRTLHSRLYATASPSAAASSSSAQSDAPTYKPPLAPGTLKIYDLSLQLLQADKEQKLAKLAELQAKLGSLEGEERKQVEREVRKLEVEAWINDPEVRWRHKHGLWDMSKPVYRHLREQKWRKEGALDLLMDRIWQMSVIPDLLPWHDPTLELRVHFPHAESEDAKRLKESGEKVKVVKGKEQVGWREGDVEPGVYVLPAQTEKEPELHVTAFHTDEKYYTLVMVDPDVPSPQTQSYTTYLHWLIPNIPLTNLTPSPLSLPAPLLPYIPPHPQAGSPYHRYTLFLLPQPGPISDMKAPLRQDFSLRSFIRQYALTGSPVPGAPKPVPKGRGMRYPRRGEVSQLSTGAEVGGGGVMMWRELWDESVSGIHRRAFGEGVKERVFGKEKKADPFVVPGTGRKLRRYY